MRLILILISLIPLLPACPRRNFDKVIPQPNRNDPDSPIDKPPTKLEPISGPNTNPVMRQFELRFTVLVSTSSFTITELPCTNGKLINSSWLAPQHEIAAKLEIENLALLLTCTGTLLAQNQNSIVFEASVALATKVEPGGSYKVPTPLTLNLSSKSRVAVEGKTLGFCPATQPMFNVETRRCE